MFIDAKSSEPIFKQIATQLEDFIFTKIYKEEEKIPSTTELSLLLNVNPHTVLKGMNILVDDNIIYKKRGVGMFVSTGAFLKIAKKRKASFVDDYIKNLIIEAKKLQIDCEELVSLIKGECDKNV